MPRRSRLADPYPLRRRGDEANSDSHWMPTMYRCSTASMSVETLLGAPPSAPPSAPLGAPLSARLGPPLRALLMALLTSSLVAPAAAQLQRNFPPTALRGSLVIADPPDVILNGRPARLAPGARIRGKSNMVELTGGLVGAKLLVNYTLEINGFLQDVWILRPEEADVRPWPVTLEQAASWTFDPVTQTWSKP